ncbi:MAG: cell division control protein Cdc6, partial [Candidatus Thermoplasmatota archaeon]|nr:cell division control protein Cdc6 [Candidatus Thermoplasmatota archaeon]
MSSSSKNLFEKFTYASLIVKGQRQALEPGFVPDRLPHREKEAEQLAEIISPSLKNFKPSNVIIFGKPGVGKTSVVKFVEGEIYKAMQSRLDVRIKLIDVN